MKVKASFTLPARLLARIDDVPTDRSAFIERAARGYLARLERVARNKRDAGIINANAKHLNTEAKDVLGYQRIR